MSSQTPSAMAFGRSRRLPGLSTAIAGSTCTECAGLPYRVGSGSRGTGAAPGVGGLNCLVSTGCPAVGGLLRETKLFAAVAGGAEQRTWRDWRAERQPVGGFGWRRTAGGWPRRRSRCLRVGGGAARAPSGKGLGWVAVTGAGSVKVKVSVPRGIGVAVRPPLMPFDIWEVASRYTGAKAVRKGGKTKSGKTRKGVGRN